MIALFSLLKLYLSHYDYHYEKRKSHSYLRFSASTTTTTTKNQLWEVVKINHCKVQHTGARFERQAGQAKVGQMTWQWKSLDSEKWVTDLSLVCRRKEERSRTTAAERSKSRMHFLIFSAEQKYHFYCCFGFFLSLWFYILFIFYLSIYLSICLSASSVRFFENLAVVQESRMFLQT